VISLVERHRKIHQQAGQWPRVIAFVLRLITAICFKSGMFT